jgi:hypothetical protein
MFAASQQAAISGEAAPFSRGSAICGTAAIQLSTMRKDQKCFVTSSMAFPLFSEASSLKSENTGQWLIRVTGGKFSVLIVVSNQVSQNRSIFLLQPPSRHSPEPW